MIAGLIRWMIMTWFIWSIRWMWHDMIYMNDWEWQIHDYNMIIWMTEIRDCDVVMWLPVISEHEMNYMTIKEDEHVINYMFDKMNLTWITWLIREMRWYDLYDGKGRWMNTIWVHDWKMNMICISWLKERCI